MPQLLALCLEDLEAAPASDRYLQCVALPGRQPGLAVDLSGKLRWLEDCDAAVELWVSGDDRLMAFRASDATPPSRVERAGRGLLLPVGKPVVLVSGDELSVAGRRFRVHLHGATEEVHAPRPWRAALVGAVAAATLGAALGGIACGAKQTQPAAGGAVEPPPSTAASADGGPIEIRDEPPSMAPVPAPTGADHR